MSANFKDETVGRINQAEFDNKIKQNSMILKITCIEKKLQATELRISQLKNKNLEQEYTKLEESKLEMMQVLEVLYKEFMSYDNK